MKEKMKNPVIVNEEEYSRKPVPTHMRAGWTRTAAIYAGNVASTTWCMIGGGLIVGLSFWDSMLALVLGLLVLSAFVFIPLGKIGMAHGVNTYVIGEAAFGAKGSNIATAIIVSAIPCIAWYGVQVNVASSAIAAMLGIGTAGTAVLSIVIGLVFIIPSIYGTKFMAFLNYAAIPAIVFIVIYGTYAALSFVNGTADITSYHPGSDYGLLWGINLQIGAVIVGCSFVSDYTRWQENSNLGLLAAAGLGLLPFPIILTVTGIIMAVSAASVGVTNTWNPAEVMVAIGMPVISIVFVVLLQWTTCISASYSGSLALEKLFGGKRWVWTIVVAVVGCFLAVTGIINYFLDFVNILAQFVAPVAGVITAEYYLVSKRELIRKEGFYWPGIISWAVGCAAAYTGVLIPAVSGIIVAGAVYTAWHYLFKRTH